MPLFTRAAVDSGHPSTLILSSQVVRLAGGGRERCVLEGRQAGTRSYRLTTGLVSNVRPDYESNTSKGKIRWAYCMHWMASKRTALGGLSSVQSSKKNRSQGAYSSSAHIHQAFQAAPSAIHDTFCIEKLSGSEGRTLGASI